MEARNSEKYLKPIRINGVPIWWDQLPDEDYKFSLFEKTEDFNVIYINKNKTFIEACNVIKNVIIEMMSEDTIIKEGHGRQKITTINKKNT